MFRISVCTVIRSLMCDRSMCSYPLYVFCYGTLKKNEPNNPHLNRKENGVAEFIGAGRTKEKFPLIVSSRFNLPFLLHQPGIGKNVKGEIYQVDDKMLVWMDWFEDHPDLYTRRKISIVLPEKEGTECECWTYMLEKFPPTIIEVKEHLEEFTYEAHAPCYIPEEDDVTPDNFYDALVREAEHALKGKKEHS